MATGTVTTYIPDNPSVGSTYTLNRIKVVETWNDATNKSSFTFTYQGKKTTGSLGIKWSTRGVLKVNGTTLIDTGVETSENITLDTTDWKDMLSATLSDVSHNSDGSLSITIGRETTGSFSGICMYAYYNSKAHYGNCGSGDYTLVCHKNQVGSVRIDNGTSFDTYQVYIDNGTSFDLYVPYIDNGTSWELCSG